MASYIPYPASECFVTYLVTFPAYSSVVNYSGVGKGWGGSNCISLTFLPPAAFNNDPSPTDYENSEEHLPTDLIFTPFS